MSNRTASATLISRPAPLRRARRASLSHPGWGLRRIHPDWWPLPSLEVVEERLRNYRGLWETLSEGDLEFFRNYVGPEVLGNPKGPKRKF